MVEALLQLTLIRKLVQKIVPLRLCQSHEVEIIDKGVSINSIQPPLSITQSRELSHQPKENDFLNKLPNFLRRRKFFFLLLFLWGCSSSPTWNISHQKGSQKEFDSSRLSYPLRDKVNGIGVEMVFAKNNLRTYLEVHSQTIPPYRNNPKEALVKITAGKKTVHGIVHRHQGGQRASLPQDLQELIVNHLLEGSQVKLELIGYSTTLQPSDFPLAYQEIRKTPLNLPVQFLFKL